jgi:hypothetical protein
MSDRLLDAIRQVDPCPEEVVPPSLDDVRTRLQAEPPAPARGVRGGRVAIGLSVVVAAAVAIVALVLIGHRSHRAAVSFPAIASTTRACRPDVRDTVLPPWARAGFSERRPRIAHALGRSGRILAIVWGQLDSPPSPDHHNKINWVSRVPVKPGHALTIQAQRMSGSTRIGAPVRRRVPGGPNPSIIDLPSAGCWRVTLRWSGYRDQLDLRYERPG